MSGWGQSSSDATSLLSSPLKTLLPQRTPRVLKSLLAFHVQVTPWRQINGLLGFLGETCEERLSHTGLRTADPTEVIRLTGGDIFQTIKWEKESRQVIRRPRGRFPRRRGDIWDLCCYICSWGKLEICIN